MQCDEYEIAVNISQKKITKLKNLIKQFNLQYVPGSGIETINYRK